MEGVGDYAGLTSSQYYIATLLGVVANVFGDQSLGWEHYEVHEPEPHILLFK